MELGCSWGPSSLLHPLPRDFFEMAGRVQGQYPELHSSAKSMVCKLQFNPSVKKEHKGSEGLGCHHQREEAAGSCAGHAGGHQRGQGLKCCGAAWWCSAAGLVLLVMLKQTALTDCIHGVASILTVFTPTPRGSWAKQMTYNLPPRRQADRGETANFKNSLRITEA